MSSKLRKRHKLLNPEKQSDPATLHMEIGEEYFGKAIHQSMSSKSKYARKKKTKS